MTPERSAPVGACPSQYTIESENFCDEVGVGTTKNNGNISLMEFPAQEWAKTMTKGTHSETADISITAKPKHEWDKQISSMKRSGARKAKEFRRRGHKFLVQILAPREVQGGDSVPVSGIEIQLDWKVETRIKLTAAANDMITNAYLIDCLDPGPPRRSQVDHRR